MDFTKVQSSTNGQNMFTPNSINLKHVQSAKNPKRKKSRGGQIMKPLPQSSSTLTPDPIEGSKGIFNPITKWIVKDLVSPSMLEGHGFRSFMSILNPDLKIPNKQELEDEIIPNAYESTRQLVCESLNRIVGKFGLGVEEWRSQSMEDYVTLTIYYENTEKAVLECSVLNTILVVPDMDEVYWGNIIDFSLHRWDIREEKIMAAIVATSRPELLRALTVRGITLVPCLVRTLQECAENFFRDPEVACTLVKCRRVVGLIGNHKKLTEANGNDIENDYPPVWTTTYNMLEQLVTRQKIVARILKDEIVDHPAFKLEKNDWKIMTELVTVLKPLNYAMLTLCESKTMPLVSLLKPLISKLVSTHFKVEDKEGPIARSLKQSISDLLNQRYANGKTTSLLQMASVLDPRFKELLCIKEEDRDVVATSVKSQLSNMIREAEQNKRSPPEKDEITGMEFIFGDYHCSSEDKARLKFLQYLSETTDSIKCCPLQWWAKMSAIYPNLRRLANKYNCIPACCGPISRIHTQARVHYDMNRAALSPDFIDKLLFLNGNHPC